MNNDELDKVFENQNTSDIIEIMHSLQITSCFHDDIDIYERNVKKYEKFIARLRLLEEVLYNSTFQNFALKWTHLKYSYDAFCSNVKKAMLSLFLLGPDCHDELKNKTTTQLFYLYNVRDHNLWKFLNNLDIYSTHDYSDYFDHQSSYPYLGLILIIIHKNYHQIKNVDDIIKLAKAEMRASNRN